MERTWLVSAFVDIRGFGTWIYRAGIPTEIKEPFIDNYFAILRSYVKKHKDVHFKYLGDGFLLIKEFSGEEKTSSAIVKFVKSVRDITNEVKSLIESCEHGPDGVRTRITEGYAYKIPVIDSNDPMRENIVSEFIEYFINTAERLMEVNPEITCLVTEGLVKALGKGRPVFRVQRLKSPSCYPKSVNREDIDRLWILKF